MDFYFITSKAPEHLQRVSTPWGDGTRQIPYTEAEREELMRVYRTVAVDVWGLPADQWGIYWRALGNALGGVSDQLYSRVYTTELTFNPVGEPATNLKRYPEPVRDYYARWLEKLTAEPSPVPLVLTHPAKDWWTDKDDAPVIVVNNPQALLTACYFHIGMVNPGARELELPARGRGRPADPQRVQVRTERKQAYEAWLEACKQYRERVKAAEELREVRCDKYIADLQELERKSKEKFAQDKAQLYREYRDSEEYRTLEALRAQGAPKQP